jgi:hypothetical protein
MKKQWILVYGSALLFAVGCADTGSAVDDAEGAGDAVSLASSAEPVAATAGAEEQVTPRPAAPKPNDEGAAPKAPPKLVAPFRGAAELWHTRPASKRVGNMVVTTIRVQNATNAPIAGLRVDEFWYDKGGQPVTGAKTFRHPRPLQPGEIIDVVLEVPSHPQMVNNSYKFEHANGTIKPVLKAKL